MSKSLDTKFFKINDFGRGELAYANRHGLDHDCASVGLCARLDVTTGWGNIWERAMFRAVQVGGHRLTYSEQLMSGRRCLGPPTSRR